ncbi:phosphopentomutase [Ensifer adhaerens]|uniref:phosphopentomutase n=1 Tax=Ensifer adhaerens TaxID=106592 RepID=UPI000CF01C37|nr:phosphopentomutase [Ensifer adhaerens]
MSRVFILVLDSLGIGSSPDAERFGDSGANTLLHIAQRCAGRQADDGREGILRIPNLCALGLGHALELACGKTLPGEPARLTAAWAVAREISAGKDTPSGHWEMMGVPVEKEWGMFPAAGDGTCFPAELLQSIAERAGICGWLGDCHGSGTEIISRFGVEHMVSNKPIFYTSADSVFQVAGHEETFGLDRLYALCEVIRREIDPLRIGRVIARPFIGQAPSDFRRTNNRRDYTTPPFSPTVLDQLVEDGGTTIGIGKITDIFAHQGITKAIKAYGTEELFEATLKQACEAPSHCIVMTNFVDFDQSYGHRRDVAGYARELELFDRRLPKLLAELREDDLLLVTADHGCDPTWPGSDHTREYVPQLAWGHRIEPGSLGMRDSFADLGQTAAHWLNLRPMQHGTSFF